MVINLAILGVERGLALLSKDFEIIIGLMNLLKSGRIIDRFRILEEVSLRLVDLLENIP
jgi:hypothetical protein